MLHFHACVEVNVAVVEFVVVNVGVDKYNVGVAALQDLDDFGVVVKGQLVRL